jgi:hypothetical protein
MPAACRSATLGPSRAAPLLDLARLFGVGDHRVEAIGSDLAGQTRERGKAAGFRDGAISRSTARNQEIADRFPAA